ncbi:ABC transporter permease [Microbacterium proteolyticum]|uniref:ABC transporter permease n=1 Tax=Microbacterium proteolyticum TaxID=1572644 RepID=UPI001FAD3D6D|nr:ABC transporter permease subunit [Microbacterium proteolyticum]MCI9857744.1 ABC transporter permease subunit [Microbacterium proteolyticum]
MDGFRIPVGSWVDAGVDWVRDNLSGLLDLVAVVVRFLVGGLSDVLLAAPIIVVIVVAAALAWLLRSWKLALGTVIGFALILAMGQWVTAMQTLALVLVATVVAVAISVPLGIWSARNPTVRAVLKPILDFMQTMPAFVYLIPAITFFSIGVVPGVVSTVIFALPPGVRLTELGIRGVDSETVEAGHAFGATPGQILRGIQLPLAMPTIMAGVNQVIMLALSMAVVAGIVGADGLGKEVVESISTVNLPQGVEAGLSVVVLAVYLDRLTAALGNRADNTGSLLGVIARRRAARPAEVASAGATSAPHVDTASADAAGQAERAEASPRRAPVSTGR